MSKKNVNYAVRFDSVGKKYLVYNRRKPTFLSSILNLENKEVFWALKNFTLDIKKGDKVGIVGKNGAGKSTLLKLVAGISTPTTGNIITSGKVVSLLDPNAGFHPDFTGYENIRLNGLLLGMENEEINSKMDDIIKFADIGKFINEPFYTYSGGMRLRLGFSICMFANADTFLFDETIFAGDQFFIKKVYEKLVELFAKKDITLLITTHVPELLGDYCNKGLWIDKGKIVEYGSFSKVTSKYKSEANK